MKIFLHQPTCIGCGSCVDMTPAYFYFNEDGKAAVYGAVAVKDKQATELFPEDEAEARTVAATCPSKCIEVK